MKIVYNREEAPKFFNKSVFLAGPTPRDKKLKSWRTDAIEILKGKGYDGVVFCPEDNPATPDVAFPDYDTDPEGYVAQVDWENKWLQASDCILFWVARELPDFPGLTTNVEFGRYFKTGKISAGSPKSAVKNTYLRVLLEKEDIKWYYDLDKCIDNVLEIIGDGANRVGSERLFPIHIWNHPTFSKWHLELESNKNNCSIEDSTIEYTFWAKIAKKPFLWIIHPNIKIGKEKRNKTNEFVIGRTDLCTLVVHSPIEEDYMKTKIVIIKEFRSPVRNKEGYVYELPSGSIELNGKAVEQAFKEFEEETGVKLKNPKSAILIKERQCVSTFSSHTNTVYSYELSEEEINKIEKDTKGKHFGLEKDSEMTYVEIQTIKEILDQDLLDWSMLGVIFETIQKAKLNNKV